MHEDIRESWPSTCLIWSTLSSFMDDIRSRMGRLLQNTPPEPLSIQNDTSSVQGWTSQTDTLSSGDIDRIRGEIKDMLLARSPLFWIPPYSRQDDPVTFLHTHYRKYVMPWYESMTLFDLLRIDSILTHALMRLAEKHTWDSASSPLHPLLTRITRDAMRRIFPPA